MVPDWVVQTHFESLGELLPHIRMRSQAERIDAELDGLAVSAPEAFELARDALRMPESESAVAAATLVAMELRSDVLYPTILDLIAGGPAELRNAVRRALRLAAIAPVREVLVERLRTSAPAGAIAILDVLTFHRVPCRVDFDALVSIEDGGCRTLLMEAFGRRRDLPRLWGFREDTDPGIRRGLWRCLALAGDCELRQRCLSLCSGRDPRHDAIRFLGIIAGGEDFQFLRRLAARSEPEAAVAVEAMGILGAAELIPDIVAAVARPATAEPAARALERVSGGMISRDEPPPPPPDMSEDELDFWIPLGAPQPAAAEKWWHDSAWGFAAGKRYQAGRCVSESPLGDGFDELPDDIRADVYLRQCALCRADTPDWELETWPWRQRAPRWSGTETTALRVPRSL